MKTVLLPMTLLFSSISSLVAAPILEPLACVAACKGSFVASTQTLSPDIHGATPTASPAIYSSLTNTYHEPYGCSRGLLNLIKHWTLTSIPYRSSRRSTSVQEASSFSINSTIRPLLKDGQKSGYERSHLLYRRHSSKEMKYDQQGWKEQVILLGLFLIAAVVIFVSLKIMFQR